MFKFEIIYTSSRSAARVGRITTPHGIIDTPQFVPVATNAALKAVDTIFGNNLNLQLLFCNTYHLMIYPGEDTVASAGGLHSFMNRKGALITDSGGFQVFSLAYGGVTQELKSKGTKKGSSAIIKIDEEGVLFRSYRDGTPLLLTPETSIRAQKKLGADIILPFDELPPYHIDKNALIRSLHRTHRWQERSLIEHKKHSQHQALYGIIHGGVDDQLRTLSNNFISSQPFDGIAIGGSLGKTHAEMYQMLQKLMPQVQKEKPRHLLGIGDLGSLIEGIKLGIDSFDSSHPTKCARHGLLLTHAGGIKIMQSKYKRVFEPLDTGCGCYTCQNYTVAYLHHLFKQHEPSSLALASIHNLAFMNQFMQQMRTKILNDEI
jgi:queuine tRNA-ribosyltransferase